MNWFSQTFRKVHILYVSPQWAKRRGEVFDAALCAESLAEAGVDCVELYTKDHHGVCYYPCSLGLPYSRDIVGELLPELQKRDIRLINYVSVCYDNYALGIHPEWRAVTRHGDPYKTGPFVTACLSSPYRVWVLQQIRELAEGYPADGYWLDIIPLARDVPQSMWMTTPNPAPCSCLSCQRQYEAATGEPLPLNPGEAGQEQAFQFLTDQIESFLLEAKEVIRKYRPDALMTYNGAGSPGDPIKCGDLVSIEGHAPNYARQSFISRWGKGSGQPFEILTAGGLPRYELGGGWNSWDQKPPALMQLESAIAVAHGGSTVFGMAPYPDGSVDPGQFSGFAPVFRPIRELEPWLRDPLGVSDVALLLTVKPRHASSLWSRMQEGAENFLEALLDGHQQFDILVAPERLDRYQLVILPDQAALSDDEAEQIRAYVRAGGRLLATGGSGLWDESGKRRGDFALADVYGVSYRRDPCKPFAYVRLRPGPLAEQVTKVPIYVDRPPLEVVANGAQVLADLLFPEATRTDSTTVLWGDPAPDPEQTCPGISEHSFGQGLCWYVAWPLYTRGLPNAWLKRLAITLAREGIPHPVLKTTAPPGVEVVLNRQADRYVVHLVNYHAGDQDRSSLDEHGMSLTGVQVQLNLSRLVMDRVSRVYTPPGHALSWDIQEGWLRVAVPPVRIHTVLVIE